MDQHSSTSIPTLKMLKGLSEESTIADLKDSLRVAGYDVDATLVQFRMITLFGVLRRALKAMEYARFKLDPGRAVLGDQFICQEDMDREIEIVKLALEKLAPVLDETMLLAKTTRESE